MVHDSDAVDPQGNDETRQNAVLGPGAVDNMIRQAISMCWFLLPSEKKNIPAVKAEIRRLVERALSNLDEDSQSFQSKGCQ